jgi:hypothetical protein
VADKIIKLDMGSIDWITTGEKFKITQEAA